MPHRFHYSEEKHSFEEIKEFVESLGHSWEKVDAFYVGKGFLIVGTDIILQPLRRHPQLEHRLGDCWCQDKYDAQNYEVSLSLFNKLKRKFQTKEKDFVYYEPAYPGGTPIIEGHR